jgi:hypothetical protein
MEDEEEAHLRLHGYSSSPMVSLGGSFEISPPGVGLAGFLGKASEGGFSSWSRRCSSKQIIPAVS